MKLSIVVPSYNQGPYITETMESLFNQQDLKQNEMEVIVMDGGSTDSTVDILKRYSDRLVYWVSEKDKGQTDALIRGFEKTSGEILGWVCSDDLLEPRTVREVLDFFTANPDVDFVYGDAFWIDKHSHVITTRREIPFNLFIFKYDFNYIPQPSAFWRRGLYDKVGGLDPTFNLSMDGDLWARFATLTRPRHISRMWSRMRAYPEAKTWRLRGQSLADGRRTWEKFGISYDNLLKLRLLKIVAKVWRIAWRFSTGCYFNGYRGSIKRRM